MTEITDEAVEGEAFAKERRVLVERGIDADLVFFIRLWAEALDSQKRYQLHCAMLDLFAAALSHKEEDR